MRRSIPHAKPTCAMGRVSITIQRCPPKNADALSVLAVRLSAIDVSALAWTRALSIPKPNTKSRLRDRRKSDSRSGTHLQPCIGAMPGGTLVATRAQHPH